MSAEYTGKLDDDKTVPVLPRPIVKTRHRIRAMNLTSDPDGLLPTDQAGAPGNSTGVGDFWFGADWRKTQYLSAGIMAKVALEDAIDAAWY